MPTILFPRRLLPLLLLLVFSAFAAGQDDYYWVDSEGNRHYGDRVERGNERWDAERLRNTTPHRPESYRRPDPPSQADNCAAQWAAYERSSNCFASCRRGTNNVANCGHCRQMTKPSCR